MFAQYAAFEKNLSPSTRAFLRALLTIAGGALTTALMAGLSMMVSQPNVAILVLIVGAFKTFIDAFGQGLVKYFTAHGELTAAAAVQEIEQVADLKLTEFADPMSTVGKFPPMRNTQ